MILKCGNKELLLGSRTYVMGILNLTPDSFSDSGKFNDFKNAISHVEKMLDDGADIIDIGAESTRPFSKTISLKEELKRILNIVIYLTHNGVRNISVDTRKAEVARQCILEGASWINDVSAFSDINMPIVAAKADAVILMHAKGVPENMQSVDIVYDDLICDIKNFLFNKIKIAEKFGISKKNILIDPGVGFGKMYNHNLKISKNIKKFKGISAGVVYGSSRKSFLGEITGIKKPMDRDIATLATTAFACMNDVDIVRVHDVKNTVEIIKVLDKIKS
jgi:dihydropteroate synthase